MKRIGICLVGAAFAVTLAGPAAAQGFGLSEVRAGLFAQNAYSGFLPDSLSHFHVNNLEDVNFEALFRSPRIDAFAWLGSPRPVVGATLNTRGRVSLFYGALNWHLPLFHSPFYLEGEFGAAANTGYLDGAPKGQPNMGCRVNFYEGLGIGANLGDNMTATLKYEHSSNDKLCFPNNGTSNLGVQIGWKF